MQAVLCVRVAEHSPSSFDFEDGHCKGIQLLLLEMCRWHHPIISENSAVATVASLT